MNSNSNIAVSSYFQEVFNHILTFFILNEAGGQEVDVYIVDKQSYCFIHCILREDSPHGVCRDYVFYHATARKNIKPIPKDVKLVSKSAWKNSKHLSPTWTLWLNLELSKCLPNKN